MLPGRLAGDLSVILNGQRSFDFIATEDSTFLRISATELTELIEHDAMVASSLMQSVADNLLGTVGNAHALRMYASERGVDFSEFDEKETTDVDAGS